MDARARAEREEALRVERLDRWDEIDVQIDRFCGGLPLDEFARYELRDRIERLIDAAIKAAVSEQEGGNDDRI